MPTPCGDLLFYYRFVYKVVRSIDWTGKFGKKHLLKYRSTNPVFKVWSLIQIPTFQMDLPAWKYICRQTLWRFGDSRKLIDKQKEFVNLSQLFQSTNYIWDKEIFIRLVNEVKFFLNINLISEDSVKRIKKELLILLNELEKFQLRENIHPEKMWKYIYPISILSLHIVM